MSVKSEYHKLNKTDFNNSMAFSSDKAKYYNAFKQAHDAEECGSLNDFIITISKLLLENLNKKATALKLKFAQIEQITPTDCATKSERRIYSLIAESSILSDFGISNEEIMSSLNISKRTVLYVLQTLRSKHKLIDTRIGKTTYHRLDI